MISELQTYLVYWPLIAAPALVLLLGAWWYLRRTAEARRLRKAIRSIASEYRKELVIPDGMDGEIQLQHVLLTARGILVMDLKRASGPVFAGEKLEDWTVMEGSGRFKFKNPLAALRARTAAVRAVAKDVPVHGRIVFLGDPDFVGGRPDQVLTLDELQSEFATSARSGTEAISAFHSSWQQIQLVSNH